MYEKQLPARAVRPGAILAAVSIAQLMVALDMSVVNIALPEIRAALGFSAADLAWVVNAYTLAFGGLLLLGGRLGDLLGRRAVFLAAAALFAVASVVGGLASSSGTLIAARAVQGVAAAGMAPAALSILMTTFAEGPERTRALTVWTILAAAGGALGVLLGGILSDYASWRWVLLINVPIALAALGLGWRVLPRGRAHTRPDGAHGSATAARRRPDLAGALLATVGMTTLVLGVVRTGEHGWGSLTTVVTLVAAVVLLVAFVVVEARVAAEPLIRIGLLVRRGPGIANLVVMLVCSGQFAAFYFVSLQVQQTMGYAPATTGVIFLPFCLGLVAGSVAAMRLVARRGPRPLLMAGALLAAAGMLWFAQAGADSSFLGALLGPMLVTSFGLGLCFVPATVAATSGVAPEEAGMASGIHNSARQVGGAIGLAALVTIAASHEASRLAAGAGPVAALSDGQQLGLTVAAGVIASAAVLSAFLPSPARAAPGPETEAAPA